MHNILNEKITMGQGEYVVFHKFPKNEQKELAQEIFEKVYKIMLKYSPAAIINEEPNKVAAKEKCLHRYEWIKSKVKKLDPSLEVAFVPRTLYELIFIRKCIKEDLKGKYICPHLDPLLQDDKKITLKTFKGDQTKYKAYLKKIADGECWHLAYFNDAGDNEHAGVKEIAYRLNQVIVKDLLPSSKGFTLQEFAKYAEKEIEFLKAHHKDLNNDEKKKLNSQFLSEVSGEIVEKDCIASCLTPGPTTNFGYESYNVCIKPMGVRNEADAQIIRNAIALDCSKIARSSFLLYRGADFQKESTSCWENENKPYSLSLGTGLFAGCLYDGGATAFHYMRNQKNAYAIPIPFHQLKNSLFYIPPTNTICQLFGHGEIFHARTRVWKDYKFQHHIEGVASDDYELDHLKSNLSQKELNAIFQEYKKIAVQLK